MIKKICLLIIILFIYNVSSFAKEKSIRIKYKVNNEFITSYDIIKETKYLIALNRDLEKIDKNQLNDYAENSLLKEKIKKHEIEKYYELDYKTDTVNKYLDKFMEKLNIKDISNFENYLKSFDCQDGYILDGYPRNLQQVKDLHLLLSKLNQSIDVAISLTAEKKELIKRLIKRSKDSGRSDDAIEIISKRQDVYWNQTAPIIKYYRENKILKEVDGLGSIEEITEKIIKAIR